MAKRGSPEWWAELRPEQAGKETERLVKSYLEERNRQTTFAWHRLPDATSARGVLAAQPADFLILCEGRTTFLEVKALKHPYRLPKDRLTQHAVLNKFCYAGARTVVLVHHYVEGVWRFASTAELEYGVPSWDLRSVRTETSLADILDVIL